MARTVWGHHPRRPQRQRPVRRSGVRCTAPVRHLRNPSPLRPVALPIERPVRRPACRAGLGPQARVIFPEMRSDELGWTLWSFGDDTEFDQLTHDDAYGSTELPSSFADAPGFEVSERQGFPTPVEAADQGPPEHQRPADSTFARAVRTSERLATPIVIARCRMRQLVTPALKPQSKSYCSDRIRF